MYINFDFLDSGSNQHHNCLNPTSQIHFELEKYMNLYKFTLKLQVKPGSNETFDPCLKNLSNDIQQVIADYPKI